VTRPDHERRPDADPVVQAAARVSRRITQYGRGPGLTVEQIRRLADEWEPLAGALADLMAALGEEPPEAWRVARRRWGKWQ
jgi:hypothetical protein